MPFTLTQRLQSLGVATQLGAEIQRQIANSTGNVKRLQETGMPTGPAKILAERITAKSMTANQARKLTELGVIPAVVKILQTAVAA